MAASPPLPDSEVPAKATRRRFPAAEEARILDAYKAADVHHGNARELTHACQVTLDAAHAAHPERFVRGRPEPLQLPAASYINRPLDKEAA